MMEHRTENNKEKSLTNKSQIKKSQTPIFFGIRHLSPAGAWHLRKLLDRVEPEMVLIEGPSDFNEELAVIPNPDVKPPFAMLAYTKESPIHTILYPLSVYSPEYQAILWAHKNQKKCRFIDLPSGVFLAFSRLRKQRELEQMKEWEEEEAEQSKETAKLESQAKSKEAAKRESQAKSKEAAKSENSTEDEEVSELEESARKKAKAEVGAEIEAEAEVEVEVEYENRNDKNEKNNKNGRNDVYQRLDKLSGEDGQETFWERTMEHTRDEEAYLSGADRFGEELRGLTLEADVENAEDVVREAYMKRQIEEVLSSGIPADKVVVVTGAFHVKGLRSDTESLSDAELKGLPVLEAGKTLMPYSYYRLSSRSGYGAGNKAPAYYELLWKGFLSGEPDYAARSYLSRIAAWQRENGNIVSSAEVIEAMRLSFSLASLQNCKIPALRDLRDAAVTCMGHGNFGEVATAVADTEIGTAIGELPQGVSRTSIQEDFYQKLDGLNLRKYCSVTAEDLRLDLREKRTVKSEKAAFLDLERSFFLHKLRVLGISFVRIKPVAQDSATWAEGWTLCWTPEAEIELVEAQLKGDTVLAATSFHMKEKLEENQHISAVAEVLKEAFLCGMPEAAEYAVSALQQAAIDAAAVDEIANTIQNLSYVIQYGDIRKISSKPLIPVMEQLFFRVCLILAGECICDDEAAKKILHALGILNDAVSNHDFLSENSWIRVITEIADRDDLNTKISGYAAAILLERGKVTNEELEIRVSRRLSKGVPAELGAGWFEGLSMKNRYALIARLSLWETLDHYLETLDDEEFKRALLFLRRAFADFSAREKSDIAENLGEVWNLNKQAVSEVLNMPLTKEAEEMLDGLDDFDFGDI